MASSSPAVLKQSRTAIGHPETARNLPSAPVLEVLLGFYEVPERLPFFLDLIDAARKGRNWWDRLAGTVPSARPTAGHPVPQVQLQQRLSGMREVAVAPEGGRWLRDTKDRTTLGTDDRGRGSRVTQRPAATPARHSASATIG